MRLETVRIEENGCEAILNAYLIDQGHKATPEKRRAVLILPGGGYHFVSAREGEPIALKFLAAGMNCFILWYSVAPDAVFPTALRQAARAMTVIRGRADEFGIDPAHVAVMGFSAGGHLAASLGVLWNDPCADIGAPARETRPDALALSYPVITSGVLAHRGSFDHLLGDTRGDGGALDFVSLEKRVHPDVPPTFLWHTGEDAVVPVENSLLFAAALRENKVPFEMHIFPNGGHGLALADEETGSVQKRCQAWVPLCIEWLKGL